MSEREQQLAEALRKAHAVIQGLKARGTDAPEPIAIIGVACRLPGAEGPDAFWTLLREERSAIRPYPAERSALRAASLPSPDGWHGGYLDGIDRFAADFFGIAPEEADRMSPLHRILLETCWQAIECAAIAPASLRHSATGVFMGLGENDYLSATRAYDDPAGVGAYFATANVSDYAVGRVAYQFGLCGPAVALNTGCSSSLAAVHLACASLQARECDLALAGGVQVNLMPWGHLSLQRMNVLAADGRCRAFSDEAAGFVRGEGCGVVVLKRLADARREGDPVLAVIRASATNNNGPRSGFTAPNGEAEKRLVGRVLSKAGPAAAGIGYVEAHATGTRLGDAVEAGALGEALAEAGISGPVLIGSVKPVIGHLEAAAGIASLLKALLVLRHRHIPATLFVEPVSTLVEWSRTPLRVATTAQAWPEGASAALVCSFGMSGTNVCLLLERPASAPAGESSDDTPQALPLSARSDADLRAVAAGVRGALAEGAPLSEVAATLSIGRRHYARRLGLVAADSSQAAALLGAWLDGGTHPSLFPPAENRKPLAFLATGQGAQYAGMGAEFYQGEPAFRAVIDACDACYAPLYGRSLRDLICGQAADAADAIHQTGHAQPALYAYSCAMAALWRSWGIVPDFVLGHSLGEFVAAHLAGVFSLEEGLRLCAARGALMQALPPGGAMLAAMASETAARQWLAETPGVLALAAINGPESVVLSGDEAGITALEQRLSAGSIKHRRLQVSHAFHSPLIEPALERFRAALAEVSFRAPTLPLISNVTGREIAAAPDGEYWLTHARSPVRFAEGMATLARLGCGTFLEIGPAAVLTAMGQKCLGSGHFWLASAREGARASETLRHCQAALYAEGHDLHWDAVYAGQPSRRTALPGHPLARTRHWLRLAPRPAADAHEGAKSATAGEVAGSARALLLRLIREVTDGKVEEIGDDDGFFSLGLNSIQWAQIHNRLEEHYAREIPITLVFTHPTLGELAASLDAPTPEE